MSIAALAKRIGTTCILHTDLLAVMVRILDAKQAYGNNRFLVTPVAGDKSAWVDESRLTF